MRGGELIPISEAGVLGVRQADSVDIQSQAMGCHPDEIPKFDRFYADHGVKVVHDPTGIPHFSSRRDKIKAMNSRGMRDNDEVSGGRSR